MNILQSIILGLVQGITEFLPISSSAHLIIARGFLNIPLDNTLAFDVFLNTATLLAVIYCFWGEIKRLFLDFLSSGFSSRSINLIYSLIIGTIPAALIGYKYGDSIENAFRTPQAVAWALIAGSIIMFAADRANKFYGGKGGLNLFKSFVIGCFQTLALVPGISRSGASISGGLFSKLSREEAIRFSFLLYIPISFGALLKTILDVQKTHVAFSSFLDISHILAFLAALATGSWAVKFMVRYLAKNSFTVFIVYRILLAACVFLFLH